MLPVIAMLDMMVLVPPQPAGLGNDAKTFRSDKKVREILVKQSEERILSVRG